MTTSKGEEALAFHLNTEGIDFVREYRFCPERRWRADFYLPQYKTLVEVEGGTWVLGRHNRGSSIDKDFEKYNKASLLGFTLLRYSTAMVMNGTAIQDIRGIREHQLQRLR